MGVDCRIMLPGNVRVRDVMSVVAVAVGFQPTLKPLGQNVVAEVEGVTWDSTYCSDPSYGYFKFDGRQCYFSFEPSDTNPGGRLLFPKSTAFWCILGQRLVDFFGGKVDYNDCDDVAVDYARRNKSSALNAPTDGEDWRKFQERIVAVKPITLEELEGFTGNTGYNEDYRGKTPGAYNTYTFDDAGRMIRGERLAEAA